WFVRHPPAPLEKVKFMLNLDMVGRMRDSRLAGLGAESAKGLVEAGRRAGEGTGLELSLSGGGFGPSDQTSFYAQGIPVLQLFTGAHAEYHTPGDDVSLLNGAGMVRVLDYADRLLREIARPEVKLVYRKSEPPRVAEAKPRGGRPYLGSVPDFTQPDSLRGVRLQGVQPGSPAEKAGLAAGDILVNLDGVILDNLYDFAFALRNHKPGDEIEIVFLRGGERRATRATLAPPGRGHGR
ncbi:MAG TPA: M28 family peptidase, partial [Bacteroidetes bacterium]|nr:M28 family peptidase [Bacteroidota bacterium]